MSTTRLRSGSNAQPREQLPASFNRVTQRQHPTQRFGVRMITAILSGATLGAASIPLGGIAGIIGAVIGTLGGSTARAKLAAAFHKGTPAAFIEDAVTIVAALIPLVAAR